MDINNLKSTEVLKVVNEWLQSDDVFVTDGKGGVKLPNAFIDCNKGTLIKKLAALQSVTLVEEKEPEAIEFAEWLKGYCWYEDLRIWIAKDRKQYTTNQLCKLFKNSKQ